MKKSKEIIVKFFDEMLNGIGLIVDNIYTLAPEQKDLNKTLKDAWKEILPMFNKIKERLNNINHYDLAFIGLSGHQLLLKYEIYKTARFEFENMMRTDDLAKENRIKILKVVRNLLKAMDNILGSLSIIISQVHAVRGFKESIEDIISLVEG